MSIDFASWKKIYRARRASIQKNSFFCCCWWRFFGDIFESLGPVAKVWYGYDIGRCFAIQKTKNNWYSCDTKEVVLLLLLLFLGDIFGTYVINMVNHCFLSRTCARSVCCTHVIVMKANG